MYERKRKTALVPLLRKIIFPKTSSVPFCKLRPESSKNAQYNGTILSIINAVVAVELRQKSALGGLRGRPFKKVNFIITWKQIGAILLRLVRRNSFYKRGMWSWLQFTFDSSHVYFKKTHRTSDKMPNNTNSTELQHSQDDIKGVDIT